MLSAGAGIARLLKMDGPDLAAFMIAGLIGFVADFYLPHGPWSGYASVAIAYHLFLAWLVITADHETGISLSFISSVLTHLACVGAVCGLGFMAHSVPYFGLIRLIPGFNLLRYGVAAFAIFERNWLFSGGRTRSAQEPVIEDALSKMATQEDYEAWVAYLGQRNRPFRKPGVSVKAEYELWLRARTRNRPPQRVRDRLASDGLPSNGLAGGR